MSPYAAQIAVLVVAVMSSVVLGQTPASKNDETKPPPAKAEQQGDAETIPILRQSMVVTATRTETDALALPVSVILVRNEEVQQGIALCFKVRPRPQECEVALCD